MYAIVLCHGRRRRSVDRGHNVCHLHLRLLQCTRLLRLLVLLLGNSIGTVTLLTLRLRLGFGHLHVEAMDFRLRLLLESVLLSI